MEAVRYPAPPRHRSPRSFGGALAESLLVACAFSAGVHVALAPEHLGESALLGLGFLASAALLLALGLGIYVRPDSVRLPRLIALLSGALIAAYVASRTVGLPVLHPAPEAVDPLGVITKGVEVVAVALSLRLFVENAAGSRGCQGKRRTRWTTISPISLAGSSPAWPLRR
jgi:hypothetical protein